MLALTAALIAFAPSPPYRLETRDQLSWFVSPEGKRWWSIGVDCVDLGEDPAKWNAKNPGYSALKIFPNERAWTLDTLQKFRSWGINSLGAWSNPALFAKYAPDQRLPHFECLHLGAYNKVPYNDLFSPETLKAINDAARDQILRMRDDPSLVGYFTDNELGWWDGYLIQSYLKLDTNAPGRRRLTEFIRRRYRNQFARFRADWQTPETSFDAWSLRPTLVLKPGGKGIRLVRDWMGEMASYYYRMVRDAVRKHDQRRLILGDRYAQFFVPEIAAASRPFVDGISTNYGADWTDGTLTRYFLGTLHELTQKPVLITEFYMTAMENRSGNRNSSGGFPVVQTQAQRAAAFRQNLIELASRPYVVGAHWFQYWDEPAAGRGDGEDYNMGLIDTQGRPYEEMIQALKAAQVTEVHAKSRHAIADPTSVPPAPKDPLTGLLNWPRARAFVPAASRAPMGDLYVTRDASHLYLGAIVMDYVDESLYADQRLPAADRGLWRIELPGRAPVTIRFMGKNQPATSDDPSVKLFDSDGLKHTVIAAIPMPQGLKIGDKINLKSEMWTHARADYLRWQRPVKLSR